MSRPKLPESAAFEAALNAMIEANSKLVRGEPFTWADSEHQAIRPLYAACKAFAQTMEYYELHKRRDS